MKYSEKLQNPLWQKKRLEVFNRDNFCCQMCNDFKTMLHVHHLKYSGEPWEAPLDDLQTLCSNCHFVEHYIWKEEKASYWQVREFDLKRRVYHREDGTADLWDCSENEPILVICFKANSECVKYLFNNLEK